MNNLPLFSVLIANYNNTKYIEEAVASIKKQTYGNWEIIIVDDCSTDNPDAIYRNLSKEHRVRIFRNSINRKTASTFKKALDLSNGDICGFLGPEDVLEKSALEKTVKCHLKLPDCSIVYTFCYLCDEKMEIKGLFKWGGVLPDGESQLTVAPGKKITSFATFKRSFYDFTKGIDIKYTRGFDQDFYYKMEEVGKVYCIKEPLYFYRQHDGNISLNENNVKAWYWLYVANKDAYYRRKKQKLNIKNITYGDLQRTYINACLLKIDQKIRLRNYRNICFYYLQLGMRFFWDKDLLIYKRHKFFLKRFILRMFKR